MGLGKDLAQIRKQLGVELDELQGLTKLSMELLDDIESDRIFTSPTFNSAYRRNFIRSYARALKIKETVIVKALDDVESGNYDHNIFKEAGAPDPENPFGTNQDVNKELEDTTPKAPPIKTELNYDEKTRAEALRASDAAQNKTTSDDVEEDETTHREEDAKEKPTGKADSSSTSSAGSELNDKQKDSTRTTDASHSADSHKKEEETPADAKTSKEPAAQDSQESSPSPEESPKTAKEPTKNQPTTTTVKNTKSSARKQVDDVNWAQMGKRFNEQQAQKSNVLLISVIAIVSVTILSFGFLYRSTIGDWMASFSNPDASSNMQGVDSLATDSLSMTLSGDENPAEDEDGNAQSSDGSQSTGTETNDNENQTSITTRVTATIGNSSSGEQANDTGSQVSDSLRNALELALPDTLQILVYAAYDKLEPVRIVSDLRSSTYPYWIEEGQAYRFGFQNEIRIRGQFSRMLIIYNNTVIENVLERFFDGEDNTVRITRSDLLSDEFNSNSEWVLPDGVRAPRSIEDGFNL